MGVHRSSVDRWLNSENGVRVAGQRIKIRWVEAIGGHRKCHPADVIRLLDTSRSAVAQTRAVEPPADPPSAD
jgi:hypothetical protein